MSFFSDKWRGIVLCAVLAVPCWFLGKLVPVVGAPVFAILLGMLVALVWPVEAAFKSGVGFVSKKVLQYAVILLGFGLNISVVLATGKQSLPIIVCTIATSLIVAYVLHKVMNIPGKISTLIGVGSSICGGSAVAAINFLKQHGCKNIIMMNIIGAPEGVAAVQQAHPDVEIYLAALDEKLNEHAYIVPGLGDAGDRIFGTK